MTVPIIIDVSHHQGKIDWARVATAGVRGAWIKSTEGRTWVDPRFRENTSGAWRNGIVTGAYHFAHPRTNSPAAEAAHFLSLIGDPPARSLPVVLDLEDHCEGMTARAVQAWVRSFRAAVEADGWDCWLYSYVPFLRQFGFTGAEWIARYHSVPPQLPCQVWQYTRTAKIPGIKGDVDGNVLRPDVTFESLIRTTGTTPAPTPPPPPPVAPVPETPLTFEPPSDPTVRALDALRTARNLIDGAIDVFENRL